MAKKCPYPNCFECPYDDCKKTIFNTTDEKLAFNIKQRRELSPNCDRRMVKK